MSDEKSAGFEEYPYKGLRAALDSEDIYGQTKLDAGRDPYVTVERAPTPWGFISKRLCEHISPPRYLIGSQQVQCRACNRAWRVSFDSLAVKELFPPKSSQIEIVAEKNIREGEVFIGKLASTTDPRGSLRMEIVTELAALLKSAVHHGSCKDCIVHGTVDCPHLEAAKKHEVKILLKIDSFLETYRKIYRG